jgi:hypothetical protein
MTQELKDRIRTADRVEITGNKTYFKNSSSVPSVGKKGSFIYYLANSMKALEPECGFNVACRR